MQSGRREEIELQEFNAQEERKKQAANNQIATAAVIATESLDLAVVYTMFLKPTMQALLEETAKFILFPVAAAASVITAALMWRQAYLDRSKKDNVKSRNVVRAVVETVAAAAVTTAVIGGLVATATFALATPIIFTATYAAKTLFNAGSAIYYLGKSVAAPTAEKKDKYRGLAKGNAIAAVAGAIGTAVVASVFLFGKVVVAAVGLALSIFGAAYAIYLGYKGYKAKQKLKEEAEARNAEEHQHDAEHTPKPAPGKILSITHTLRTSGDGLRQASNPVAGVITGPQGSPVWKRRSTGESDAQILAARRNQAGKGTTEETEPLLEDTSTSRASLRASGDHS